MLRLLVIRRRFWTSWAPNSKEEVYEDTINFFIYGASTSVALYASQFTRYGARAGGKKIKLFGAASKARHSMLTQEPYSFDALVDYRDAEWPPQVRRLTCGAGIHLAFDCISEGNSVQQVASTLSADGKLAIVRSREGGAWKASDLPTEPSYGAVWEGLGEEVQYQGFTVQRSPSARAFTVAFYRWLSQVMGSELFPNPIRLMPGGLQKIVEDGFVLLGSGDMGERQVERTGERMKPVSAEKLVYKL